MKRLLCILSVISVFGLNFVTDDAYATPTSSLRVNGVRFPDGSNTFQAVYNVMDPKYGVKCDGTTDDTTALQSVIDDANTNGGRVVFPAKTCLISAPLKVYDHSQLEGIASESYIDFTNDWQQANPTYYQKATIIQYKSGSHGAIITFTGSVGGTRAYGVRLEGLTFRVGQARTVADVFTNDTPSHFRIDNCKFENLTSIISNNGVAYGGGTITACRFFGLTTSFSGVFVDTILDSNVFTSNTTAAISLTSGAGLLTVVGNRFEYGGIGVQLAGTRPVVITGNLFDAHTGAGVDIRAQPGAQITGNFFWRNGSADTDTNKGHIRVSSTTTGVQITGNHFLAGTPDGGGTETPRYVIEFESAPNAGVIFRGNNTASGYTLYPMGDRFSTSTTALDADVIDIRAGNGTPNTGTDTFASQLSTLNPLLVQMARVNVYDARRVISNSSLPKIFLEGVASSPLTIDHSTAAIRYGAIDNVTLGSRTYTYKQGRQYVDALPNGFSQNGWWDAGSVLYLTTPTGAVQAYEVIDLGTPQTYVAMNRGAGPLVATKTGNYTALITDSYVPVSTTGGVVTITLPAPATVGAKWSVAIVDVGFLAGTNNITVARSGAEKINNVAGNFTINTNGAWKEFVTNGTDWFVR